MLLASIMLAQYALAAPRPQSYNSDGSDTNPHSVDTDAGASGSSTSFNISKGGVAAIIIVVVLVIIFGGTTVPQASIYTRLTFTIQWARQSSGIWLNVVDGTFEPRSHKWYLFP
jgi:hypothetical protein